MKLQFATIEALTALLIAISAMTIGSQITGFYQHEYYIDGKNLSMRVAAYDFASQMSENSAAVSCMAESKSGAACMTNYTSLYEKAYGIRRIGIINGSRGGNYSYVYCGNGTDGILCVGVS